MDLKKYIPTKRKIMQLYFGLLLNANLKGFVTGNIYQGKTKILCAPGINCYSCPGAIGYRRDDPYDRGHGAGHSDGSWQRL